MKTLSVVVLLAAAAVAITFAHAQAPPPAELHDPFLDKFVGEWRLERKMGNGKTTESRVRGEWALNHHWVRLDYGGDKPGQYQAVVFIGYDDRAKSYICHWMDVYGASESALGSGKLDDARHAIEFNFDSKEVALRNTFAFDPQSDSWTSLIRQTEKGEWKTFAEEKWTRLKK